MKLKKIVLFKFLAVCIILSLTSCSVVMAARTEGTAIEKVQRSRTRGQFLSCGATVVSSERLQTGELVEVYQYKKERGSAVRAFMHGFLDVSTCGLWEVVGTPIEACVDENKYFAIKVYYDKNENPIKIELL